MTTWWEKSLQCKSRAADDVVHHHLLPASSSCRKSVQSLKDVVDTKKIKPRKPKPSPVANSRQPVSRKPEPGSTNFQTTISYRPRTSTTSSTRQSQSRAHPLFPALTDLPEGHPSRNVVEIIFHTSWSPKAFSGRIEMVFKVQNSGRTVSRFEEYREVVKSRASSGTCGDMVADVDDLREDHARCLVDGNEVMRFHCLGPTGVGAYNTVGGAWAFHGGKGAAMCTFPGSGVAHESGGGGRGRKAMLVCRVISGRVCKRVECDSFSDDQVGFDSVSGETGELLVFDSRAVLPCFLVFYKL